MNETVENMMMAKGINPTAMRILILEYLLQQPSAVSLPNLENEFQHSDRTTLYRTLKTFEEKGLIHNITLGTGATQYALCTDACGSGAHYDLHLHFYCNRCGETFCLPKTEIPQVVLPNNFELEELNLVAKGVCDHCNPK